MGGLHSVSATKSLLLLVKTLFVCIKREMKDGELSSEDIGKILSSREFHTAALASIGNIRDVSKELKELDFADGLDLSRFVYDVAMDIVEELKK